MKFNLRNYSLFNMVRMSLIALLAVIVAACGGGGGSPGTTQGTGSGSGSNGPMQLTLLDANGNPSTTVTSSGPLTARAVVNSGNGPVANVLVTFALGGTIAKISPAAATALTDANGVAQVSIQSTNTGNGADKVTATATVGTTAATASASFSVGSSANAQPAAINFVKAVPADKSIVIKGSGGNGRTEVALLTFSVVDSSNVGLANQNVTFSIPASQPVTLTSTSAVTDQNGQVTVALNSGATPTTVRVTATITGTSISAISDTVTVTTGQPTQAGFSISLQKFYVEGLNHDDVTNTVTVRLADSFGGAVADGTQVVFTVDSGAIVGTGGAACLTVQGGCTVSWHSQNPRTSSGVATITATASNGSSNLLSTSIQFYVSGSAGRIYQVAGSGSGITRVTTGGEIGLNFATVCDPQTFNIEVVDVNGNPMPEGTVIAAVNLVNSSAVIFPPAVQFSGGLNLGAIDRGTFHAVTVTPGSCNLTGTKTVNGSLLLSVTTPLGGTTYTNVNLGSFKTN
jgi:hypothetical protein